MTTFWRLEIFTILQEVKYLDVSLKFVQIDLIDQNFADTAGHLFSLEHRYFGESRPVPDTSVENLQFLSPQQVKYCRRVYV